MVIKNILFTVSNGNMRIVGCREATKKIRSQFVSAPVEQYEWAADEFFVFLLLNGWVIKDLAGTYSDSLIVVEKIT